MRIEFARRITTSCALGQVGTEGPMTDDLVETAHQDYIEVTSKKPAVRSDIYYVPIVAQVLTQLETP